VSVFVRTPPGAIRQVLELVRRSRVQARTGQLAAAIATLDSIPDDLRTPGVLATKASMLREVCAIDDCRRALGAAVEAAEGGVADALRLRRALTLPPMMRSCADIARERSRASAELAQLWLCPPRFASVAALPQSLGDFYLAYHGEDDRALRGGLARLLLRACPDLGFVAEHCGAAMPAQQRVHRRRRIGFVSSHFRDHTILLLNRGLMTGLDREQFEVYAFFVDGIVDGPGRALASGVEHAVELGRDLSVVRQQIAAAELDLLVFPDLGMDLFTWYLAFARLARVQCAGWGHPITSGIPTVDWFLSSATLDPDGNERFYTERLARLPEPTLCYSRPEVLAEDATRVRRLLPADERLYVCAQNLFKLHPDFDSVLAAILQRDRRARLVLLEPKRPEWAALLRTRLQRLGVAFDARVTLLPPMPRADYLALLAGADVVLDPMHFGGGNTSLEALAVGAPVVTLPSRFLRGRLTLCWLRTLGVLDTVVESEDGYVEMALAVACEPARRHLLVRRIRAGRERLFGRRCAVAAHQSFFVAACDEAERRCR